MVAHQFGDNLSLLGVFKYLDFLIESWNLASLRFTDSLDVGVVGLALPVGISFYTFQTMSYTIDIYRKKQKPYDSFLDFAVMLRSSLNWWPVLLFALTTFVNKSKSLWRLSLSISLRFDAHHLRHSKETGHC